MKRLDDRLERKEKLTGNLLEKIYDEKGESRQKSRRKEKIQTRITKDNSRALPLHRM